MVKTGPGLLRNINRKSYVPDRSVSVPITFSNLERWDGRGPVFPMDLHTYIHAV